MGNKKKWLHKKCKEYITSSGKCKIKVPTRYNDYCEKDDCPKQKKSPDQNRRG